MQQTSQAQATDEKTARMARDAEHLERGRRYTRTACERRAWWDQIPKEPDLGEDFVASTATLQLTSRGRDLWLRVDDEVKVQDPKLVHGADAVPRVGKVLDNLHITTSQVGFGNTTLHFVQKELLIPDIVLPLIPKLVWDPQPRYSSAEDAVTQFTGRILSFCDLLHRSWYVVLCGSAICGIAIKTQLHYFETKKYNEAAVLSTRRDIRKLTKEAGGIISELEELLGDLTESADGMIDALKCTNETAQSKSQREKVVRLSYGIFACFGLVATGVAAIVKHNPFVTHVAKVSTNVLYGVAIAELQEEVLKADAAELKCGGKLLAETAPMLHEIIHVAKRHKNSFQTLMSFFDLPYFKGGDRTIVDKWQAMKMVFDSCQVNIREVDNIMTKHGVPPAPIPEWMTHLA